MSAPHCQTPLPEISADMHLIYEGTSLQIKASLESSSLAPKISHAEIIGI